MKLSWMMAVVMLVAAGCSKEQKKVEEKITRVGIAPLQKRVFQQRIPLQGTIEPVEHAVISARIGGTLENLNVDEGDVIIIDPDKKENSMLFSIDRKILENQVTVKENEIKVREAALASAQSARDAAEINKTVAQNKLAVAKINQDVAENAHEAAKINLNVARNDLNIAKINLEQAKRDFERADNLKKSNAISNSSWESAETDFKKADMAVKSADADFKKAEVAVKSAESEVENSKVAVKSANAEVENADAGFKNAEAEVRNAEAQLEQAKSNKEIAVKNLADSKVYAPFDCVVTQKFVEKNEFVSAGQEILKLENQNTLEVTCFLSAVYYDQLIPGKTIAEFPAYQKDGKALRTVVSWKAPAIDPESRTFKIKIKIDNPGEVSPAPVSGMLCELDIILVEREGYGLPESAVLLRAENKMIAFTVNGENRAESVEIERGIVDRGYAEILNASDLADKRFVITGQNFINNNSLLKEIEKESE